MPRGRPKKIKEFADEEKPIKPQASFPFKVSQVVCDMKVVEVHPGSERAIHFVRAERKDIVKVGDKGEKVLIPKAVVREPLTQKVIWGTEVYSMSLEDFQNMVNLKKEVQSEVE